MNYPNLYVPKCTNPEHLKVHIQRTIFLGLISAGQTEEANTITVLFGRLGRTMNTC
jgi:hypothetical protein